MTLARTEFEAALEALAGAGDDPRVAEVSSDIAEEIKALDAPGAEGPEQGEGEEGEPSPLDELATTTPQLTPGQLEQERSLIDYAGLKFDIPFVVNDRVIGWVDFFTNRNREKFIPGLVRSGRFLPMIQRIFEEEGLPKDLAYMAHVESAYKVNAFSRAKAKGIFQFIAGTGRRYGLRIDTWVDERSDPEKATRAAAAYLKDLYAMFGDWYLAMAAYNAGEGKIQRVINRTGQRDFWAIASSRVLRNETVNYVPAILAATLISKDPKRFGLEFEPEPPIEYETIRVEGSVHLKVLARCAGIDFETMQKLNPALRRRQTPAGTTDVRVPPGTVCHDPRGAGGGSRGGPVHRGAARRRDGRHAFEGREELRRPGVRNPEGQPDGEANGAPARRIDRDSGGDGGSGRRLRGSEAEPIRERHDLSRSQGGHPVLGRPALREPLRRRSRPRAGYR